MRKDNGDLNLGTKVINAVVSPRPSDDLEYPVEMTFKKIIVSIQSSNVVSTWINHKDVFKNCRLSFYKEIFNFCICCLSIKDFIASFCHLSFNIHPKFFLRLVQH